LFDFGQGFDSASTPVRGVKVSLLKDAEGNWLRVASGHAEAWPGLTLVAPGGHWDLSSFEQVSLDVRNSGASPVTVSCRVDNAGADGVNHCVTANISLQPGAAGILTVPLDHAAFDPAGGKLFGMRGYPGPTQMPTTSLMSGPSGLKETIRRRLKLRSKAISFPSSILLASTFTGIGRAKFILWLI
jgi:hypothetical protein